VDHVNETKTILRISKSKPKYYLKYFILYSFYNIIKYILLVK